MWVHPNICHHVCSEFLSCILIEKPEFRLSSEFNCFPYPPNKFTGNSLKNRSHLYEFIHTHKRCRAGSWGGGQTDT